MKKKRMSQHNKKSYAGKFWIGIIVMFLIIGAVITGMNTSFYGVSVGVIIGFLVGNLMNRF
jgi:hypothetical protein